LQWRRAKVVELKARGMNHGEIARELQVSKASITSDVQYLREQAKASIREYVTEHLPEQYQVCLTALDEIIKRAFHILETSSKKLKENTSLTLLPLIQSSMDVPDRCIDMYLPFGMLS
jgi:orotate phosphoribosyltransferase-like protein